MSLRIPGRAGRRAVAALVGVLVVFPAALPAQAHPFGPPPSALVSARGHSVFVEWRSAADDAIAIGVRVGLLDEALVDAYLEGPVQTAPSAADEALLSASTELRDYLLGHIRVTQAGSPCRGTVQPIGNFVWDGARVVHECAEPIGTVTVQISMLHDVHEAYRTFGIAVDEHARPAQAVFSVTNPAHEWTLAAAGDGGDAGSAAGAGREGAPIGALAAGLGGLVLVAALAVVLVGRGGGGQA